MRRSAAAYPCARVRAASTTRQHRLPTVETVPKRRSTKRVSTAVRLPADLHAELQRQALERDVSVNFLVTRAVGRYLRELGPADPFVEKDNHEGALG